MLNWIIDQPWIVPLALITTSAIAAALRLYWRIVVLETRFDEHKSRSDTRLKSIDDELKSLNHYLRNGRDTDER